MPSAPDAAAAAAASIEVRGVTKSFGGPVVLSDVDLDVAAGSTLALLGPSGCGKTTLLRILAGLESPDAGTVEVGARRLVGPGVDVPPEQRRIGLVFQDWALFPHLSVGRNVGYGVPKGAEHDQRVAAALELVGLAGTQDRMPGTLSGGQQQRIALARAVAVEPAVLLLDEPFSNLDANLRTRVRAEIHELLVGLGITTVVVTHDQEEAFVLGDQVALLHEGRIVQQAPPAEIYLRPATRWVAAFVGEANLVPAVASGATATTPLGPVELVEHLEGSAEVLLRPEELQVLPASSSGGAAAVVELVEFYGHDTVLVARLADGTRLRVREPGAPVAGRGDAVRVVHRGAPAMAFALSEPGA